MTCHSSPPSSCTRSTFVTDRQALLAVDAALVPKRAATRRRWLWADAWLCASLLAAVACTPAAPPAPSAPSAAPTTRAAPQPLPGGERQVENFERADGLSGGFWYEFDKTGLGTVANPNPFKLEPGGAPGSPGNSAHIWGALGGNRAPWSWVQLQIFLDRSKAPQDLRSFKSLRFFVKGDGGRYGVALVKAAVKDYDDFRYEFTAPAEWTEIRVNLADLRQAGWGKSVPRVFDDVTRIQFYPAQYDHRFDVHVDDVALLPTEAKDEAVPYVTTGWFPWTGVDPAKRRGTALDVSRLLDAPAGKYGPIGKRGEDFVFPNGRPVRFWGVNIVASANFPSHVEAEKLADLLAELGVNITRHHHMDAAWSTPNVFGNKPTTLELDPESMERFDYFINELGKRGIYQFFDMLVHRKATPADGVAEADKLAAGFKVEGEFDPKLIELQERFVDQFMGHKNPYTKLTYAKNPAVALVEIVNEDTLFWTQAEGDFSVKTQGYRDTLNHQFSSWLKKQVPGGRAALEKRWATGPGDGLRPEEDPAKGNVDTTVSFDAAGAARLSKARAQDTLRFLYETAHAYYARMAARLRGLGYKGLVTGSNHWTDHPLDLMANAELNFVDRHAYWSHPSGGWGYNTEVSWDPSAMVKDANLGIVGSLARRRVKGKPYSTSEWQTAAPNDYRAEGLLLVGAYASLQGFSPIQFALSHDSKKLPDVPGPLSGNFDIIEQPSMLGAWPAVSLLYHRGDVRPAELEAYVKVGREASFALDATLPAPRDLALIARTGVDLDGGKPEEELDWVRAQYTQNGAVSSSTAELKHDANRGTFQVNTPRSQGFVGFLPSEPILLANTRVDLFSRFAVVLVTALDDQPIASSKRLLVTALGNAVNTGMSLTSAGNRLANVGTAPVLIEPIIGKVTLNKLTGPVQAAKAYALGASGERQGEVPLGKNQDGLTLEMTAAHKTMHYEIVRE